MGDVTVNPPWSCGVNTTGSLYTCDTCEAIALSRDLPAGLDDLVQRQAVLAELGIDASKVALNGHSPRDQQQAARRLNRHELALANPRVLAKVSQGSGGAKLDAPSSGCSGLATTRGSATIQ